jgi:hypothetical protein
MNSQVAHVLLNSILLQVTVTTVHLQGVISNPRTEFSGYLLGHRGVNGLVLVVFVQQFGGFADYESMWVGKYLDVTKSEAISAYLNC